MPTAEFPESDATGASPGFFPSVWPGALGAPSPCSVLLVSVDLGGVGEWRERISIGAKRGEGGGGVEQQAGGFGK